MEPQIHNAAPFLTGIFGCFMVLIWLAVTVISVWAYCKMFDKAGYSWALGLLMIVPIANLVIMLYLGFSDWPILKELRGLRQQSSPAEQLPS